MAVTAAIVGTVVSAAAAGGSAYQSHAQEVHAGQAKRDAAYQEGTLLAEAQEKEREQAASKAAEEERLKQRQQIAASYGRASTMLTGPEGLGGNAAPLGAG